MGILRRHVSGPYSRNASSEPRRVHAGDAQGTRRNEHHRNGTIPGRRKMELERRHYDVDSLEIRGTGDSRVVRGLGVP